MGRGTLLLVVLLALGAALVLLTPDRRRAPLDVGDVAPDLELPRIGGEGTLRLEDVRGQVVFLNFWATWCKPCEDEIPAMERLYRVLHPEGFELLAISVGEKPSVVREFCDRLGVTFPVLLDTEKQVASDWQTFAFPESLLVDRDGTVLERYVGPRNWDAPAYVARIRRLIRSSPAGG